jgi:hypothetical protein
VDILQFDAVFLSMDTWAVSGLDLLQIELNSFCDHTFSFLLVKI